MLCVHCVVHFDSTPVEPVQFAIALEFLVTFEKKEIFESSAPSSFWDLNE